MALDPSIVFQLGKGVTPLLSPADREDQQMQREAGRLKLNALRQESEDDAAYRNVLRSGATPDELPNKLYSAGLGKRAQEAQTFQATQAKTAREAEKSKYEAIIQKYDIAARIMGPVKDQATWDIARQQTAQAFGPEAAAQMPAQYDPALIEQKRAQAMTVKDQLEQKWKEMEYTTPSANARLQAQTSQSNNAATIANSQRTADMTDARAREANVNGRVPSGYRQNPDGTLSFIQGGPADPNTKPAGGKPLNDTQAKALQFGSRMQVAGEILDKLAEDGVNTSVPGSRAGFGVGAVISALQPEQRQQLDQAKRDFINAVLRRESGAAISPSEFDSAEKQYFPQPGEGPNQRAQKKANRELATRGILAEVPDAETRVAQVRGGSASEPLKGLKGAKPPATDLSGLEAELKRRGLLK